MESSLANSSVSISAGLGTISMPGFTSKGNIIVASNISWDSLSSLKLQANQNITINNNVVISNNSAADSDLSAFSGQNINLYAGQSGTGVGTVKFLGDGTQIDVSKSFANVNIEYNPPQGYATPTNYNPFVSLRWLLDGKVIDGTPMRGPEQSPSREEALRMYTLESAWFTFDEAKRGSLEGGKYADLAVLSKDYMTVPVDQIGGIESVLTMVGGKVVYAAGPFQAFNATR